MLYVCDYNKLVHWIMGFLFANLYSKLNFITKRNGALSFFRTNRPCPICPRWYRVVDVSLYVDCVLLFSFAKVVFLV